MVPQRHCQCCDVQNIDGDDCKHGQASFLAKPIAVDCTPPAGPAIPQMLLQNLSKSHSIQLSSLSSFVLKDDKTKGKLQNVKHLQ